MTRERTTRADRGRGKVRGLAIRTTSTGETAFWFRFRLRGELLSWTVPAGGLAEARRMAEAARVKVAKGEDPRPRKVVARLSLTGAAARWVQANRRRWRPRTTREMVGLLRRHVLQDFGERDPNAITRAEVWHNLKRLAARAPVTANRAAAAWAMLYRWLHRIDQEHLGVMADPTAGLERPGGAERPRDRVFSNDEIKRVLAAATGDVGDLVSFLLHTGTRDGETRAMRWQDVDFERALWTIPGDVAKNDRPHQVPLSSGALAVLRRRDRTRFLSDRVFPFARQSKTLAAAGAAAGLGGPLRLHDLRRTVGQRMRDQYAEAFQHAALGHADARLTATYGPAPRLRALAEALQWWSDELGRIARTADATSADA